MKVRKVKKLKVRKKGWKGKAWISVLNKMKKTLGFLLWIFHLCAQFLYKRAFMF